MAYIYRSPNGNFVVDTPVVGVGTSEIITVNVSGEQKYNGVYFLQNPQSPQTSQIWQNTQYQTYIQCVQTRQESEAGSRNAAFGIIDPSYNQLVQQNPSDGYYQVLRMPYIAVSGLNSLPEQWYWDKFIGLLPPFCSAPSEDGLVICTTNGSMATGEGIAGGRPQSKKFTVFIPSRVLVSGKSFVSS